MAKHEKMPIRAKEDLDDMVYVSDNDDDQSQPSDKELGMIPQIKHLYDSDRDSRGPYTWTDKCPTDLPALEETEETARYALLIRNAKCYDGHKQLAISSILVQSPLLKMVLSWVLKDYPSMAPDLDRLEFVSPFRPFVHRWQRLTEALSYEEDPETQHHIQLFHDALKHELGITLEARDDFFAHKTVSFHCLWMIFEPGEIVMATLSGHRQAFKLKTAICVSNRHENSYRLECELLRWDGGEFGWAKHVFEILEFDGMKKITDLDIFPLHFHPRAEKIKKQLVAKGRIYEKLQGQHHKQYRGIALDVAQPFYVDSKIMIDTQAYFCYNPDRLFVLTPLHPTTVTKAALSPTHECSDDPDESSDDELCRRSSRPGMWPIQSERKNSKRVPALTEEQLMLCDFMVKGYSLRNKRWLNFFVNSVRDIEWKDNAWDGFVAAEDHKELILSLAEGRQCESNDLRSGGRNVILTGPSGVGKTLAVELAAEALRAPLFNIVLADIELETKDPDLDSPFTDVLNMCSRWKAIMLLDGLDNRSTDDLDNQDAYLGFLKALEAHSSVFFVTSTLDPEDCLDDRLFSRFHACVELPQLTVAIREQIWQKCLESHKDMTAFVNPAIIKNWELNGREISNAVTAAKTLTKGGALTLSHLERVVAARKRDSDIWSFPANDRKKMKEKKIATDVVGPTEPEVVIAEEPKTVPEDDPWEGWGSFGSKKKKEKKVVIEESKPREAEVIVVEEPKEVREEDGLDWGDFGSKKKKGKKAVIEESKSREAEVIIIEEPKKAPVDESEGWAGFAAKDAKKKTKKGTVAKVAEDDVPAPPPLPAAEANWSFGTPSKSPSADDPWAEWRKPKVKGDITLSTNPEPPTPAPPADSSAGQAAEIDDWDFWASSKKTKKKKTKKPVVWAEDAPSIPTGDSACDSPPIRPAEEPGNPMSLTKTAGKPAEDPCEFPVPSQVLVCEYCINSHGQIHYIHNGLPCQACHSTAGLAADVDTTPLRPSYYKMCKCCIGKAVLDRTYCRFCGSWEGQK